MLIYFHHAKRQQFLQLAEKIIAEPKAYLDFSHVADFYAAAWLAQLPEGSVWHATGLDDGAEQFYAVICYQDLRLSIDIGQEIHVTLSQTEVDDQPI